MSAAQVLAFLKALIPAMAPVLASLEAQGIAELDALVAAVPNDVEKKLLQDLISALDSFAKSEIAKV